MADLVAVIRAKDLTKQGVQSAKTRFQKLSDKVKSLSIGQIASFGGIAYALKQIGDVTIGNAAKFETLQVRLQNMYGTVEAGNKAFETFKDLAATTPFELQRVVEAGASLKAFGLDAEDTIKVTADLAAFMGRDIVDAASAMGRAFAGGAGAADIFRETGILNLIKMKSGISDFKGDIDLFREAMLKTFLDPSSGIAGSTDKLAQTFKGKLSNMRDAISITGAKIGDILLPYISKLVEVAGGIVTVFGKIPKPILEVGLALGGLGIIAKVAGVSFSTMWKGLMGPIGWIIAAAGLVYVAWQENLGGFQDIVRESWEYVKAFGKIAWTVVKDMASRYANIFMGIGNIIASAFKMDAAGISSGVKRVGDAMLGGYGEVGEKISGIWGEMQNNIANLQVASVANTNKKIITLHENKIRVLTEKEKEAIQSVAEFQKEQKDAMLLKMIENEIEAREQMKEDALRISRELNEASVAQNLNRIEREMGLREEFFMSDKEREIQHLADKLEAWNENWANTQMGQEIFLAGMQTINEQFATKEEKIMKSMGERIATGFNDAIVNLALNPLNKGFDDWHKKQTDAWGHFWVGLVEVVAKSVAQMMAELVALKIVKSILGGPLSWLGLLSQGGIVQNKSMGGLVMATSGGGIVPTKRNSFQKIGYAQTGMMAKGFDTVPAMLRPGEAVISTEHTRNNLPAIRQIMSGQGPSTGDESQPVTNNNFNFTIHAIDARGVRDLVRSSDFKNELIDTINDRVIRLRVENKNVVGNR